VAQEVTCPSAVVTRRAGRQPLFSHTKEQTCVGRKRRRINVQDSLSTLNVRRGSIGHIKEWRRIFLNVAASMASPSIAGLSEYPVPRALFTM